MIDSWLTPDGEVIQVGNFAHNQYAYEVLSEERGLNALMEYMDEKGFNSAYEVLHERGWVRIKYNEGYLPAIEILGGTISLVREMKNTIDPAMNSMQMAVAKRLCAEAGTPFLHAINDKRFWG